MSERLYRINNYSSIRLEDAEDVAEFYDQYGLYMLADDQDNMEFTVWPQNVYAYRLNKIYSGEPLYNPIESGDPTVTLNYDICRIKLKQGLPTKNLFGILAVFKSNNNYLFSRIIPIEQFSITDKAELIGGVFYTEEFVCKIPKTDSLSCEIVAVSVDDISIDTVTNYPTELVPLIEDEPLPDYIRCNVEFTENHFLSLYFSTDENKSVKQSLLDYFGETAADVQISYKVEYGNDTNGYLGMRLTNLESTYFPLFIGLDLTQFNDTVTLVVTGEATLNGKTLRRIVTKQVDISSIPAYITDNIAAPTTVFKVDVTEENVINQTVIETKEKTKFVKVMQPVFSEMLTGSFTIENKFLAYKELTARALLRIEKTEKDAEQMLISKITSDGVHYFDLSLLQPISKETNYTVLDADTNRIIGKGTVTI